MKTRADANASPAYFYGARVVVTVTVAEIVAERVGLGEALLDEPRLGVMKGYWIGATRVSPRAPGVKVGCKVTVGVTSLEATNTYEPRMLNVI